MKAFDRISNCLVISLLLVISTFTANAQADVVVIVAAKSSITSLTAVQISRIFLGKISSFPGNGAAIPIDQIEGSAIRDEFYSKVVHKDSSEVAAYWAKIIFTGDGRPPQKLDSNVAVRKAVANNLSAIGYIDKRFVNRSVKIILAP